jgi:putative ABC transport system substrate-binding protein
VLDSEGIRGITEHLRQQLPEVIAFNSSNGLRAIESAAPGVPIVFIAVSEPVALGLVASLAHPGGNMTGFSNLEPTLGAKWLGMLKQIAPQANRISFIYNPSNPGAKVTLRSTQSAAGQFSFDVLDTPVRDITEIESGISAVAREPGGALLLPPDPFLNGHRKPHRRVGRTQPAAAGLRAPFICRRGRSLGLWRLHP